MLKCLMIYYHDTVQLIKAILSICIVDILTHLYSYVPNK